MTNVIKLNQEIIWQYYYLGRISFKDENTTIKLVYEAVNRESVATIEYISKTIDKYKKRLEEEYSTRVAKEAAEQKEWLGI